MSHLHFPLVLLSSYTTNGIQQTHMKYHNRLGFSSEKPHEILQQTWFH